MLWPLCETIHRGPGHVTRCDPSTQQCNPTQYIPDLREVADVSVTTSGHSTPQFWHCPIELPFVGPLSDTWEVTGSTVMRKWTWLFMNGTECRRPIHTATEFVNVCQGWPNAPMSSGIILKTTITQQTTWAIFHAIVSSHLILWCQVSYLLYILGVKKSTVNRTNCHIKIYSHDSFRHVYQESSYLQKNVSIGKQTKILLFS